MSPRSALHVLQQERKYSMLDCSPLEDHHRTSLTDVPLLDRPIVRCLPISPLVPLYPLLPFTCFLIAFLMFCRRSRSVDTYKVSGDNNKHSLLSFLQYIHLQEGPKQIKMAHSNCHVHHEATEI